MGESFKAYIHIYGNMEVFHILIEVNLLSSPLRIEVSLLVAK